MSIENYKSHLVEELGWATWDSNEKKISQLTLWRITGMSFWLMLGYIVLLTERTGLGTAPGCGRVHHAKLPWRCCNHHARDHPHPRSWHACCPCQICSLASSVLRLLDQPQQIRVSAQQLMVNRNRKVINIIPLISILDSWSIMNEGNSFWIPLQSQTIRSLICLILNPSVAGDAGRTWYSLILTK